MRYSKLHMCKMCFSWKLKVFCKCGTKAKLWAHDNLFRCKANRGIAGIASIAWTYQLQYMHIMCTLYYMDEHDSGLLDLSDLTTIAWNLFHTWRCLTATWGKAPLSLLDLTRRYCIGSAWSSLLSLLFVEPVGMDSLALNFCTAMCCHNYNVNDTPRFLTLRLRASLEAFNLCFTLTL